MPLNRLFNNLSLEDRLIDAMWKNDMVTVTKLTQKCDVDTLNSLLLRAVPSCSANKPSTIHTVLLLLGHGANANARDENGKTALMLTTIFEAPGLVSLLVEHGADINAQDNDGNTVLMLELQANFWAIGTSQVLLNNNAAVNIQNKNGDTAIAIAARNRNQWGAIEPLLRRSADPYIANSVNGKNAHQYAVERGCEKLVEFCRKNPAAAAKAKSGLTP